jgi:hypothetical protein
MNKHVKILMVIFFSVMLVSSGYSLFGGENNDVMCAGCGHKIEAGKGVELDHHGTMLHFCTEGCKDAFVKKTGECTHTAAYKCPMKACAYTSDKEGKCPNCGMALVKVEKAAVFKCTTEGCSYTSDKAGKCPHCKTELKKTVCSGHKGHDKTDKIN